MVKYSIRNKRGIYGELEIYSGKIPRQLALNVLINHVMTLLFSKITETFPTTLLAYWSDLRGFVCFHDIIGHHHAENLVLARHQDQEDDEVDQNQGILNDHS